MSKRPSTKSELLSLLGNCILVCALANDMTLVDRAKAAAEVHIRELDERFPEWRDEAKKENIKMNDLPLR